MPRQIIGLVLDENGELWIDAISPASIHCEAHPPHRMALKAKTAQLSNVDVWLRMERALAWDLVERLSDELRSGARADADEIMTNLTFRRVLNGAADPATGRMVLKFEGERGRCYRVEVPKDQSGMLVDLVRLAAAKAVEIGDENIAETATGMMDDEPVPVEAEVISLKYDPIIEREILTARLPNSLEYYFALTERQARELRESGRSPDHAARLGDRPV